MQCHLYTTAYCDRHIPDLYPVSRATFFAAHGTDFAVYTDRAVLDQSLRLTAGGDEVRVFEERVKPNKFGLDGDIHLTLPRLEPNWQNEICKAVAVVYRFDDTG